MSIIVSEAKEQIKNCIIDAAKAAITSGELNSAELTDFSVEVPANREHGDYAVNAAMVWSKIFRTAPRKIAETVLKNADFAGTYIDRYEIAGP